MTVQAGIEVSLEMLVGEMPAVACAHQDHQSDPEGHSGDASHYTMWRCLNPQCGWSSAVLPICQRFIDWAMSNDLNCRSCKHASEGKAAIRVLAPIKP